jgi:hypothetical protein
MSDPGVIPRDGELNVGEAPKVDMFFPNPGD